MSEVKRRRTYTPEQKAANKAYLAEYHQKRKDDPAYVEKRKAEYKRYHARRPLMRLLANARARAKAQNVPCTITAADLAIPQFCPVLGIPLMRGEGAKTDHSPSIDRLRPERGYVPGNVYVISERANRLKNNGTAQEHRLIADYMERNT